MSAFNLGPFRVRPSGTFDPDKHYRFLDLVYYNGGSYLCINIDTLDGIDCCGILPEGEETSEEYWQCIVQRGEKGDPAEQYYPFETITDGKWDFSITDKIIIPAGSEKTLFINNVYDGCCGMILADDDLVLPDNSDVSVDYYYVTAETGQYYMYTFVYEKTITEEGRFIWHRTVMKT